ncbi:MAG: restriction endonuclease [Clostridia bacterium]|nr:restriction endonuclease [Clostridia bacterium]
MSGEEFEKFMEQYFISKGYNVIRTPLSGDYGIDLIIEHEFGKIGIQLKRYNDKVSLSAVQEVVAGLNHYGLNSGMVITNNYFQPSAIRLAKDNNITLWDRDVLLEKTRI